MTDKEWDELMRAARPENRLAASAAVRDFLATAPDTLGAALFVDDVVSQPAARFDVLYGTAVVRPRGTARVVGEAQEIPGGMRLAGTRAAELAEAEAVAAREAAGLGDAALRGLTTFAEDARLAGREMGAALDRQLFAAGYTVREPRPYVRPPAPPPPPPPAAPAPLAVVGGRRAITFTDEE